MRLRHLAAATLALALGSARADAAIVVGGVTYVPSGPSETVIAPFIDPNGATTVNAYSGLVLLTVSGTGQSFATLINDAFYFDITNVPVHDPDFYQLVATKGPSVSLNTPDNAYEHIVYDVDAGAEVTPPYTPAFRTAPTRSSSTRP
ncbi:MAG: hypothetical protein K2X87_25765 [Gemmataceae bacterium]|nr:hypothetical protein [Gemmataceae bacterium]